MPNRSVPPRRAGRISVPGLDRGEGVSLERVREQFFTTEIGEVRNPIRESWLRSQSWAVSADNPEPLLAASDLDAPVVRAAEPILCQLGDRLDRQAISAIITDANGLVLVRFTGDAAFERHLDRVSLAPGFNFAERFVGTNGIGTALEEHRPTHVFGQEHYAECYGDLACAGVPLRDPATGQTLGLFDLTCQRKDAGPILAVMAGTIADQIQRALLRAAPGHDRELIMLREADAAELRRLVVAERQRRKMAETMHKIAVETTKALTPQEILGYAITAARSLVPCDAAWALACEPSGTIRVVAVHGQVDARALGATMVLPAASPLLLSFHSRGMVGPHRAPPEQLPGQHCPVGSWLAVPAMGRQIPAVVILITSQARGGYNPAQARLAYSVLSQAATACEKAYLFEATRRLADYDPLTGLANRRHFFEQADRLIGQRMHTTQPLATFMIDIDHFKRVNDTHGHTVGDTVLAEVARRLQATLRPQDIIGRIGGEEFAAVLGCPSQTASTLAERLRQAVSTSSVATANGPLPITVSVGMATLNPDDSGLGDLLIRADAALYQAKHSGRDRVVTARP